MGLVPADTELPPLNPIGTPGDRTGPDGQPFPALDYTKPWDTLSADERRLFARMARQRAPGRAAGARCGVIRAGQPMARAASAGLSGQRQRG